MNYDKPNRGFRWIPCCKRLCQVLSYRHFPKRQLPKGIFPSGNFQNMQFPKHQLPKSVLIAALERLGRPNLTCEKFPLRNLHIWEVATWNIVTWEVAIGKIPLGKYLTSKRQRLFTIFSLLKHQMKKRLKPFDFRFNTSLIFCKHSLQKYQRFLTLFFL